MRLFWASDEPIATVDPAGDRERVLASGAMHLAFRLSDHPVRLFEDTADRTGRIVGHAVVGGARAGYYLRDTSARVRSLGVQFHPGAAGLLFGVPADELADRHTPLESLWGACAAESRERLVEARGPERGLVLLESILATRLPRVRCLHPAVAHALARFHVTRDVGGIVKETGYSHRRFIELFRRAVGIPPKRYCRVLRFQDALRVLAARPAGSLADLAQTAGYSDQAHFNREFRSFTGLSPTEYLEASPPWTHHVPVHPLLV